METVAKFKHITYLSVLSVASITAKNGKFDFLNVQYQVAKTVANAICPKADTKNELHKKATTLNAVRKQ